MRKFYQGQDNKRKEKEGESKMKRIIFLVMAMCFVLGQATPNAFADLVISPVPTATGGLRVTALYNYVNGVQITFSDLTTGEITHFANGRTLEVQNFAPPSLKKVPVNGFKIADFGTSSPNDWATIYGTTLEEILNADTLAKMKTLLENKGLNTKYLTSQKQVDDMLENLLESATEFSSFDDELIKNNFATTTYEYKNGELKSINRPVTDKEGQFVHENGDPNNPILYQNTIYSSGLRVEARGYNVNKDGTYTATRTDYVYKEDPQTGKVGLKYAVVRTGSDTGGTADDPTKVDKILSVSEFNSLGQEKYTYSIKDKEALTIGSDQVDEQVLAAKFGRTRELDYDAAGRLIREVDAPLDRAASTTFTTYAANGQKVSERTYADRQDFKPFDDTELLETKDYAYNSIGAIRYSIDKDRDGVVKKNYYVFNQPLGGFDITPASETSQAGRAKIMQQKMPSLPGHESLSGKNATQLLDWAEKNRYSDWRAAYVMMGADFFNRLRQVFTGFHVADIDNLNKTLAAKKIPLIDAIGDNPTELARFFDKIQSEFSTNKTSAAQFLALLEWAVTNNSQNDLAYWDVGSDSRADYVVGITNR